MRASIRVLRNSSVATRLSPDLKDCAELLHAIHLSRTKATIRARALPSARKARDETKVLEWVFFCCSAGGGHSVDHPIVLKKHRKAGIVPAGDGRLTDRGMLFDGGTEVLFDVGHRAATLGCLHGRSGNR